MELQRAYEPPQGNLGDRPPDPPSFLRCVILTLIVVPLVAAMPLATWIGYLILIGMNDGDAFRIFNDPFYWQIEITDKAVPIIMISILASVYALSRMVDHRSECRKAVADYEAKQAENE